MLIFLSVLGLFLSFLLWMFNSNNYPATKFLAFFFALLSLYGLNQFVLLYSESVFWNIIISTNFTFLYYLIGPLAYFYVRSILTDNAKLRKADFLHFVPSIVFFTALIPYYFTPLAYKEEVAEQIVKNPQFLF